MIGLKTKPMFCFCRANRFFWSYLCTGSPRNQYSPDQAPSCRPRMCSSVDLPEPDGPMIERKSPCLISRSMLRSA